MHTMPRRADRAALALRGVRWGALSVAVNFVAQIGLTAAMARLLEPAAFGLMAMATIVLRLFALLSQAGLGAALVQRPALQPGHVRAALSLSLLLGLLACALMAAAAPLLAGAFGESGLQAVLWGLAPNLLLLPLGALPLALLRRELRFKAIAGVETLSYMLGYGLVGVLLAWHGAGVWALVCATLAQSLLAWVLAYALARHDLRPGRFGSFARDLAGYGGRASLVGLLEFLSANLPSVVIGRLLGVGALGLFSRAWLLTNLPVEKATGVVARVLFPLLSQSQAEPRRAGEVLLLAMSAVGLPAAAFTLALAAHAQPVVALLLGPQWSGAVPVVQALAVAVPCIFMAAMAGTVCDAMALLTLKLRVQGAMLALVLLLTAAWHTHGLIGVAWSLVAVEIIRLACFLLALGPALHCTRRDMAAVAGSVLVAGLAAWGLGWAAMALLHGLPVLWQVATLLPVAALAMLLGAQVWRATLRDSGAASLAVRQLPARWHASLAR
jgi:lipopolysaccharide exporter